MTYIIEHPRRGTLKFFVSVNEYSFSVTGARNDSDKTMQFHSIGEATRVLGMLPDKARTDCQILDSDNHYKPVY